MVIWAASFPRSGNTFFRMLLMQMYGLNTYSLHGDRLFDSLDMSRAVGHLPLTESVCDLDIRSEPYFVKTHDLPTDFKPTIYLVRDGRASVVSFAHYKQSFNAQGVGIQGWFREKVMGRRSFDSVLEQTITDSSLFGGWSGNVEAWLRRSSQAFALVRFEDLVQAPLETTQKAVASVGLNLRLKQCNLPTFEELHAKWPKFFRSGRNESWRQEMSPRLQDMFWELHGNTMTTLGYSR